MMAQRFTYNGKELNMEKARISLRNSLKSMEKERESLLNQLFGIDPETELYLVLMDKLDEVEDSIDNVEWELKEEI